MRSVDIFVDLQPSGCNFKGELFDSGLGVRRTWGSGIGLFVSPPIGSYSFPLTHKVCLLPFLSFLASSNSFRPSDSDTMTNTAVEAIALSSGKNAIRHLPKNYFEFATCLSQKGLDYVATTRANGVQQVVLRLQWHIPMRLAEWKRERERDGGGGL